MKKEITMKLFGHTPDGSEHEYYFETEMGSKYVLTSSGMSRRLKFDNTIHGWHYKCVFIPGYDIWSNFDTVIRHCFGHKIPIWLGKDKNGMMNLYTQDGLITNMSQIMSNHLGKVHGYRYEVTPLLEAAVFEFDIGQSKELKVFHPGHNVTMAIKLQ